MKMKEHKERIAIIDVGYNAIRTAIYDSNKLGADEIFSNKFRTDILNLLEFDDIDIKHQTYLCIQYLLKIFDNLSVTKIICVATAVLRGHPRAEEFKKLIKTKFGFDIDILSGEREAYLTAAGLISGISKAHGIAADLGGGSLELAEIQNKKIGKLKSLPLGTKVLADSLVVSDDEIAEVIIRKFGNFKYDNLYLIGGAFSYIGRSYISFINYPLKNLHNLEIKASNFAIFLEKLDCVGKIQTKYEYSKVDNNAISVAKALLKITHPRNIIISNYGLKEGVRFDALCIEEQEKSTIFERVKSIIKLNRYDYNFEAYYKIIAPLIIEIDSTIYNIIDLTVLFTIYNRNLDRSIKPNFIADFALVANIPLTHRERVMLSLALNFTAKTSSDFYTNKSAIKQIIGNVDYCNSRIIGNFVSLVKDIDGPEFIKEPSFALTLNNKFIELVRPDILPRAVFERVLDKLKEIANARIKALEGS